MTLSLRHLPRACDLSIFLFRFSQISSCTSMHETSVDVRMAATTSWMWRWTAILDRMQVAFRDFLADFSDCWQVVEKSG